MTLDLTSLEKSITALKRAARLSKQIQQDASASAELKVLTQSGLIQHFEFTYELCWKFMKRYLELNLGSSYVDGVSRHQLFRLATEHHLIDHVEAWMDYHKARNLTSHTYAVDVANEVAAVAVMFLPDAENLLTALQNRNA